MNSLFLRGAGLGVMLIVWAVPAAALVPEPYALYYGRAKGLDGKVLTRESGSEVIVRIDGLENTRYRIGDMLSENANYVVRVKVDDGTGYLYDPAAAREGDEPELVIRDAGGEYDIEGVIPPVEGRGTVKTVDIEAVPEPCTAGLAWIGIVVIVRAFRHYWD